jgi:hypothetical protein
MSTTTLHIIEDYVSRVRQSVKLLQTRFGEDDLLRAVRDRKIPKRGSIDDYGITFNFHGIGCRIDGKDANIDFDFGPDGTVGGFDSWRLMQFIENSANYDSKMFTQEKLDSDIQDLVTSGVVLALKLEPSPHLFYLATDYG